jgi:hypothetical protein
LKFIDEFIKLSANFLFGIFISCFAGKKPINPPMATLKPPFIELVTYPFTNLPDFFRISNSKKNFVYLKYSKVFLKSIV